MGKLMVNLQKQLKTENKEDAEKCIEVYNHLKETDKDGRVWLSRWKPLTTVDFVGTGYLSKWIYKLNAMGETYLKGIKAK